MCAAAGAAVDDDDDDDSADGDNAHASYFLCQCCSAPKISILAGGLPLTRCYLFTGATFGLIWP